MVAAVEQKVMTNEDVVKFLEDNPSFFLQNSQVLTQLNLPSTADGNIANFNDFQARKLKQKLSKYEERIALLLRTAIQNENSAGQLHGLVLQVLKADSIETLKNTLTEELTTHFDIDYVGFSETVSEDNSKRVALKHVRANEVFYNLDAEVETYSQATLLLENEMGEAFAEMVLASKDPQRFYDGQGDSLLDFFAQVISYTWSSLK